MTRYVFDGTIQARLHNGLQFYAVRMPGAPLAEVARKLGELPTVAASVRGDEIYVVGDFKLSGMRLLIYSVDERIGILKEI